MQKQATPEELKLVICNNYKKKINYLLSRSLLLEDDVFGIVRDFFKEYLNINYAFTYAELANELAKQFIPLATKKDY